MGKKNVRNSGNNDRYQIEDDFEDFGYDIKNIRRSSKKKVAKFKREQDHYDDSYWTVHHVLTGWQNGVLYRSRQEFSNWQSKSSSTHTIRLRLILLMHPNTPSFTFVSVASVQLLRVWIASTTASWMRLWRHGVPSRSRSVVTLYRVCHRTL